MCLLHPSVFHHDSHVWLHQSPKMQSCWSFPWHKGMAGWACPAFAFWSASSWGWAGQRQKVKVGPCCPQTVGPQWEQAAGGAAGCVGQLCPHRGAQGVFEFQSLKLYREKVLSVGSLNICSSANKGIKSSLQIHNLEIKGNNRRYTNTEISILHRLNDPCCRSWKEPLVGEKGGRGGLCLATSSIFCALIRGKLLGSCSIQNHREHSRLISAGQDEWGGRR